MRRRVTLISLLLLAMSMLAADHNVSIGSVQTGPAKGPWQWTIYLKGEPDAIAHVGCVQYVLKGNFPNPKRTVCSRGTEERPFSTTGTAWGAFNVSGTVTFDDKTKVPVSYTWRP
jgi:transcription initiation factor IIF auxiliary subunit